jgi:mono/diheme cytochrome c family protein
VDVSLMSDELRQDLGATPPRNRIDIFLDGTAEPILSTTPPLSFELHTARMVDGPHVMRIEAYDDQGIRGIRTIDFRVRNGPGIAVAGIRAHDVLDGTIPIVVNAYGGTSVVDWEPSQAETPAPSPTWAWVLLLLVVAFGVFYGVQEWSPTGDFARTPTYGTFGGGGSAVEAAADAAVPAAALPQSRTGTPPGGSTTQSSSLTLQDAGRGAALYSVNCAACHQPTGKGLAGVFPPLANDPIVEAPDPTDHIRTVLDGKRGAVIGGVTYASPMPAFKDLLNDEDVAAVVNHERSSWGNSAPPVSASEVAKLRE